MSESSTAETDPRDLKISEQAAAIAELTKANKQLTEQNARLEERIRRLEALLATKVDAISSKKPVFTENYSLDRNSLARQDSDRKPPRKSTGRKRSQAKEHLVSETIEVFPPNVDRVSCIHRRFQSAWRIVDGKAVYLRYDIRDLPDSTCLPLPPGVRNSRSEFGMEIILILSFLHYWIGVSQENAIRVMKFFTGLELSKSQADSLLNQLAADWKQQHDTIAELIALQMVVYIDETGWKVGTKSCYTWIFSTAEHVLFRCGVSRKKTEATSVLGDVFDGIGVTDDYAAYKTLFSEHQLCWAHLIRKAIKLVLQNPDETRYAEFLDQLCAIYHDAKDLRDNVAASVVGEPLNDAAERKAVVAKLQDRITSLCSRRDEKIITTKVSEKLQLPGEPTPSHVETFILLQRELSDNVDCLFVFVEHPEVEPTNNRSERNARREAEIRKGARTSKTDSGAKRRSIIVTVLASLQTRIASFTLSNVLAEVGRWLDTGKSLFELEREAIQSKRAPPT
jgi:transposase